MSKRGINVFASVLMKAQMARGELLTMGTKKKIDKVDVRLGQMLDEMKDSVKDEFCRLTVKTIGSFDRRQKLRKSKKPRKKVKK